MANRHWASMAGAAFLAVAGFAAGGQAQEADPKLIVGTCSGCHGPGGRSPGAVPSLNGRSAESIAEALRGFKAGQREATVMDRFAKRYTDAQINAIAQAVAGQWK